MSKFQVLSLAALLLTVWQHADAGVSVGGGYGAGGGGGYGSGHGGGEGDGSSQFYIDYVARPKYEFKYQVMDPHTGDYHSQTESRDGGQVVGEYTVAEPGGNVRKVKYHADKKSGFNAQVTNSKPTLHNGYGGYGVGGKGSAGGSDCRGCGHGGGFSGYSSSGAYAAGSGHGGYGGSIGGQGYGGGYGVSLKGSGGNGAGFGGVSYATSFSHTTTPDVRESNPIIIQSFGGGHGGGSLGGYKGSPLIVSGYDGGYQGIGFGGYGVGEYGVNGGSNLHGHGFGGGSLFGYGGSGGHGVH